MKVLIYGCGLIGGSIAKSLAFQNIETHVINRSEIDFPGIIYHESVSDVINDHFDIVCVSTSRGKKMEIYQKVFSEIKNISCGFITDCSSVQSQSEYLRGYFSQKFIPSHPIAGSEKSGFINSDRRILEGKRCIIIGDKVPKEIINFWKKCGMDPINIPIAQQHDLICASISHLPQLFSFFLPPIDNNSKFIGFYRLTKSPVNIWEETFLHNAHNIITIMLRMMDYVKQIEVDKSARDEFEVLAGSIFLKMTDDEAKKFAGTGFQTITMFASDEDIIKTSQKNKKNLIFILEKMLNYLNEVLKKNDYFSINL